MQNRRERRLAEKHAGMRKIEKTMSKPQIEEIKTRKKEYVKQLLLLRAQEEENKRMNENAEKWSNQLENMMNSGSSREDATKILEDNKLVEEKRLAKKAAKKEAQKI